MEEICNDIDCRCQCDSVNPDEYTARMYTNFSTFNEYGICIPLDYNGTVIKKELLICNPVCTDGKYYCWLGANAVELALKLLDSPYILDVDKKQLCEWLNKRPNPVTKFQRTIPEAVLPQRNRSSDSGFDLTLVKHLKDENDVSYYTTGVVLIMPAKIWYMLVPRSSMAKQGYTLANTVGIIDAGYRGEIIVALRKTRPNAEPIELPARWVQVIPQRYIHMDMCEVQTQKYQEVTSRNDTGGLGSYQFIGNTKAVL
jgi:dUTPase